jgi:type IV pilus assembly protein PilB
LDWSRREKLGEILLAAGVINVDDLQRALRIQKDSGEKLGEILVSLGALDDDTLMHYLGEQLGITGRQLERFFVSRDILSLLDENTLRERSIMPLFLEKGTLHLAMIDPLDSETIHRVEKETGLAVKPCITSTRGLSLCHSINLTGSATPSGEETQDAYVSGGRLLRALLAEGAHSTSGDLILEGSADGMRVRAGQNGGPGRTREEFAGSGPYDVDHLCAFLGLAIGARDVCRDGTCKVEVGDQSLSVRASVMRTRKGKNLALRFVKRDLYLHGLGGTGMTPELAAASRLLLQRGEGAVVIASPPAQGKTVSLYAMLKEVSGPDRNVYLSEESPLDVLGFLHQVDASLSLQRILRHSPDVVAVDDCREPDLLTNLLRRVSRRALVLIGLEAQDFPDAWARMLSMIGDPRLLATSLTGVISQRRVPDSTPRFQLIELTPALRTVVTSVTPAYAGVQRLPAKMVQKW